MAARFLFSTLLKWKSDLWRKKKKQNKKKKNSDRLKTKFQSSVVLLVSFIECKVVCYWRAVVVCYETAVVNDVKPSLSPMILFKR